ncbi:MAG: hypothetical protein NXY57DRAFT_967498 [Lentinula lateritia]|nr:MAG: hypothetical protein NXY57DRAFT_967498 [Lentinula lateritia]
MTSEQGQSHRHTQSTSSVVDMGQALMGGSSSSSSTDESMGIDDDQGIGGPSRGRGRGGAESDFWMPQVASNGQIFYINTKTGEQSKDLPQEAEDDIDLSMTDDAPPALQVALIPNPSQALASPRRTDTPKPWIRRHLADDGTSVFDLRRFRLTGDAELYPPLPEDMVRITQKNVIEHVMVRLNSGGLGDLSWNKTPQISQSSRNAKEKGRRCQFSEVDTGVDIEFGDWSNSDPSLVVVKCSGPRRVLRGGNGKKRKRSPGHGSLSKKKIVLTRPPTKPLSPDLVSDIAASVTRLDAFLRVSDIAVVQQHQQHSPAERTNTNANVQHPRIHPASHSESTKSKDTRKT